MPPKPSHDRADVLSKIKEKFPPGGTATFEQAYELLKHIDATLPEIEDDAELYSEVIRVRVALMEGMEARARELGKADDWAQVKKYHDANLAIGPLLRTRDGQKFWEAFSTLSPEQRNALEFFSKEGGPDLDSLQSMARKTEPVLAAIRWDTKRRGRIFGVVPDPTHTLRECLAAFLILLLLAAGLAVAIGSRSWSAALVCLVLLAVTVTIWTFDLLSVMRLKRYLDDPGTTTRT